MRKGCDGEKMEKMEKITVEIVATMPLPVDRLTATDCNATARANRVKELGKRMVIQLLL